MKKLRNDNKGAALVYILITVVVAGILTTGLIMLIINRVRMQQVDEQKTKEYYLADGVVEIIKNYSDQAGLCKDLVQQFTGIATIATTPDEPQNRTDVSIYYMFTASNRCLVVYYGEEYRTEITCIWDLKGNSDQSEPVIQTYEVSQTPRTPADSAEGEQPGGEETP